MAISTAVEISTLSGAGLGGGGTTLRGEAERSLSVQSLTTGDAIEWDVEVVDDDNFIDVGGGSPEDITVNTDGRYFISAFVPLNVSTHVGTESNVTILKNGTDILASNRIQVSTGNILIEVSTVASLVASDVITVTVGHDDGGTVDTLDTATVFPRVTIDFIGSSGTSSDLDRAEAHRLATQSNANDTDIIWDTEIIDTNGLIDLGGGNPERITIQTTGRYVVTASYNVVIATHAGTETSAVVRLNDTIAIAVNKIPVTTSNGNFNFACVCDFTAGDYLTLRIFHDDGGTIDCVGSAFNPTKLSVAQIPSVAGGGGSGGGRELLTANRTYYVDPAGNDSSDGLTPGTAFQTVQFGLDTIGGLDASIYDVTLDFANGTYSQNTLTVKQPLGSGKVILLGDQVTPSNVVVSSPVAGDFSVSEGRRPFIQTKGTRTDILGMRIEAASAQNVDLVSTDVGGEINIADVEFNGTDNAAGISRAMVAVVSSRITLDGTILLDNDYSRFADVFTGSLIQTIPNMTFTFGASCDCNNAFVRTANCGFLQFSAPVTMTGTNASAVTRADVSFNSVCKLFGVAAALTTATFTADTTTTGGEFTES